MSGAAESGRRRTSEWWRPPDHQNNATVPRLGLSHVRWLGGASGAGKTAIATYLATAYGLHLYSSDATIAAHAGEPGQDAPLLSIFREMSMDERWLGRDARTMLATVPWFAGERFDQVNRPLPQTALQPRDPQTDQGRSWGSVRWVRLRG